MSDQKNENDLAYAIALRARQLSDTKMPLLRKIADSAGDKRTRGELIEDILVGDFVQEFPRFFDNDNGVTHLGSLKQACEFALQIANLRKESVALKYSLVEILVTPGSTVYKLESDWFKDFNKKLQDA